MPRIKTDLLQEGMITAVGVRNMDNMLLIPEGCHLSDRQIKILCSWGIEDIEVVATAGTEEAGDPLAKLSPEAVATLTEQLKARFWHLDESNPIQMEVFKLALHRQARLRHPR